MLIRILKNWTLPIAMLFGTLAYAVFANVDWVAPAKPFVNSFVSFLMPLLIFMQLLLTFCKIEIRQLKPVKWHLWLLLIQLFACLLIVAVLLVCSVSDGYREMLEGAMVCLICPTATAAAVITGKLGGNSATLTTYTLLSNLLAAIFVPLLFPLVEPHAGISFWNAFLKILGRVFPLLLCPFFLAWVFRCWWPWMHRKLLAIHHVAFYMWSVALAIVSGQTVRSLVNSDAPVEVELLIALVALVTCAVQFYLGKRIGARYKDRISGGQALGQKNTILAIWMAYTYLNPLSSVAPGSYVLWQNLVNSYQLWKKRKSEEVKRV